MDEDRFALFGELRRVNFQLADKPLPALTASLDGQDLAEGAEEPG